MSIIQREHPQTLKTKMNHLRKIQAFILAIFILCADMPLVYAFAGSKKPVEESASKLLREKTRHSGAIIKIARRSGSVKRRNFGNGKFRRKTFKKRFVNRRSFRSNAIRSKINTVRGKFSRRGNRSLVFGGV